MHSSITRSRIVAVSGLPQVGLHRRPALILGDAGWPHPVSLHSAGLAHPRSHFVDLDCSFLQIALLTPSRRTTCSEFACMSGFTPLQARFPSIRQCAHKGLQSNYHFTFKMHVKWALKSCLMANARLVFSFSNRLFSSPCKQRAILTRQQLLAPSRSSMYPSPYRKRSKCFPCQKHRPVERL